MPEEHADKPKPVVTVRVVRRPALPDGRLAGRMDRPELREVDFLVHEEHMTEEAAAEMQEVMQQGLNSGLYDQRWVEPPEEPDVE